MKTLFCKTDDFWLVKLFKQKFVPPGWNQGHQFKFWCGVWADRTCTSTTCVTDLPSGSIYLFSADDSLYKLSADDVQLYLFLLCGWFSEFISATTLLNLFLWLCLAIYFLWLFNFVYSRDCFIHSFISAATSLNLFMRMCLFIYFLAETTKLFYCFTPVTVSATQFISVTTSSLNLFSAAVSLNLFLWMCLFIHFLRRLNFIVLLLRLLHPRNLCLWPLHFNHFLWLFNFIYFWGCVVSVTDALCTCGFDAHSREYAPPTPESPHRQTLIVFSSRAPHSHRLSPLPLQRSWLHSLHPHPAAGCASLPPTLILRHAQGDACHKFRPFNKVVKIEECFTDLL